MRQVFKNETKHINFWTDCTVLVVSDIAGVCEPPQAGFPVLQYRCVLHERVCVSHRWPLGSHHRAPSDRSAEETHCVLLFRLLFSV